MDTSNSIIFVANLVIMASVVFIGISLIYKFQKKKKK